MAVAPRRQIVQIVQVLQLAVGGERVSVGDDAVIGC